MDNITLGSKNYVIRRDILQFSYWEHFKKAKDISHIFPPEHPNRIELQSVMDDLILKITNE